MISSTIQINANLHKFRRFFIFVVMSSVTNISKGRSPFLIQNRNNKLAARFYWYSCLLGLNFSRCLSELEQEFDISESRICDLISECGDIISELERNQVSIQQLKSRFPFFSWNYTYSPAKTLSIAVQSSLNLF
ncbi:hypothetical protein ELBR111191_20570 [Elizabethkingia bruuniana]